MDAYVWARNHTRGLIPRMYNMVYNMTSDDVIWRGGEKKGHEVEEGVQMTEQQLKVTTLRKYLINYTFFVLFYKGNPPPGI